MLASGKRQYELGGFLFHLIGYSGFSVEDEKVRRMSGRSIANKQLLDQDVNCLRSIALPLSHPQHHPPPILLPQSVPPPRLSLLQTLLQSRSCRLREFLSFSHRKTTTSVFYHRTTTPQTQSWRQQQLPPPRRSAAPTADHLSSMRRATALEVCVTIIRIPKV